jgi:hypothetical protein
MKFEPLVRLCTNMTAKLYLAVAPTIKKAHEAVMTAKARITKKVEAPTGTDSTSDLLHLAINRIEAQLSALSQAVKGLTVAVQALAQNKTTPAVQPVAVQRPNFAQVRSTGSRMQPHLPMTFKANKKAELPVLELPTKEPPKRTTTRRSPGRPRKTE